MSAMSKKEAMELMNVKSQAALARSLGLTSNAVYFWPDPLPAHAEGRVLAAIRRKLEAMKNAR